MDAEKTQLLSSLREQLDHWQSAFSSTTGCDESTRQTIGTGCEALDRFLPQHGFLPGQLVEWLGQPGCGAGTLAMIVARQALKSKIAGEAIVVIDTTNDFFPPAAADWGVPLSKLIVVRTADKRLTKPTSPALRKRRLGTARHENLLWALDQSLRCPAVAAVWAYLPAIDSKNFRRLQLAAEEGRTLAMLMRDIQVRGQPSWSDLQIRVRSLPSEPPSTHPRPVANRPLHTTRPIPIRPITTRKWELELLRCRRGKAGTRLELELHETDGTLRSRTPLKPTEQPTATANDERTPHKTHPLPLASQLARATLHGSAMQNRAKHKPPKHKRAEPA